MGWPNSIRVNISTQYHNEKNTSLNIEYITYLCDVGTTLLDVINIWDECYEWKNFVWIIVFAINWWMW
ncbi:hypothetical protein CDR68_06680 [Salmonella enterica]|nr:hypothetical protein [Salmonella enterica]